ncbi:NrtR DNA-binding winged helix domain-containing protein [Caulobacter segnis]
MVVAIRDGEAVVLTVRAVHDAVTDAASSLSGLPFGPFRSRGAPDLRAGPARLRDGADAVPAVAHVEQLYTFGDKGRDAPRAEAGAGAARVVSVGYLGLTPKAVDTDAPRHRLGAVDPVLPLGGLARRPPRPCWTGGHRPGPAPLGPAEDALPVVARPPGLRPGRRAVERGAGCLSATSCSTRPALAPEAARDRDRADGHDPAEPEALSAAPGEPDDLRSPTDPGHRLSRLRGKSWVPTPWCLELTPEEFTLSTLQRTVEAIAGIQLHKQNFPSGGRARGAVEGLGRLDAETGGRPAELFRFRREMLLRARRRACRCRCCGIRSGEIRVQPWRNIRRSLPAPMWRQIVRPPLLVLTSLAAVLATGALAQTPALPATVSPIDKRSGY